MILEVAAPPHGLGKKREASLSHKCQLNFSQSSNQHHLHQCHLYQCITTPFSLVIEEKNTFGKAANDDPYASIKIEQILKKSDFTCIIHTLSKIQKPTL